MHLDDDAFARVVEAQPDSNRYDIARALNVPVHLARTRLESLVNDRRIYGRRVGRFTVYRICGGGWVSPDATMLQSSRAFVRHILKDIFGQTPTEQQVEQVAARVIAAVTTPPPAP